MSRRRLTLTTATAALAVATAGCSLLDQDSPKDDAEAFAKALSTGDLSGVRVTDGSAAQAQKWWERTRAGMGESRHQVEVEAVREGEDDTASVTLSHAWRLEGSTVTWTYETTARMVRQEDSWAVDLSPGAVVPGLSARQRLELSTVSPDRGDIMGAGDRRLVTERPVVRLGIDKTLARPGREVESARELARLLEVDVDSFADRVEAAGDKAFVEALVLRPADVTPRIRRAYPSIPGARAVEHEMPLAPTREFARAILGTVGPVTAEIIKESKGQYSVGDVAGLSGLQQRYDERLRGRPGMVVVAVGERSGEGRTLFDSEPQDGEPLRITLDEDLQREAEQALSLVRPASALVAIRPSTGDILAAASGPGSEGYSTATVGQYAPGSTFKVVSSLALLRAGRTGDDTVSCPRTTVVDGKEFKNYSDYPESALGRISLRQAVANSCNTAFISQRGRVGHEDLAEAAASLGLGRDHDVGFPAFFGSVPRSGSETGHAAALIGQGQVLASPMAMAAVAGSVAAGRTVVPRLLQDTDTDVSGSTPLTRGEAEQLTGLMAAVVDEGSGVFLSDVPGEQVLAKTGTAEFGDAEPPRTHAWMVASQGDLAVAVFVEVGESGSQTAGPILEQFLRAAR